MTGGAGNDVFRFGAAVAEIGATAGNNNDRILDFTSGQDIIDVSAIDANTLAGKQEFTFIGTAAFTALGQLRYQNGQLQGTQNRTVLSYLFKPIEDQMERAFRER